MFVLLVICSFLGIVVLPVVFLLDPLEVRPKSARSSSRSQRPTPAEFFRRPPGDEGHPIPSNAK